jgi:hypothetical protein
MVEFKMNVNKHLPYDRKQYISFSGWYGISFQLRNHGSEVNLREYLNIYEPFFKSIISTFPNGSSWIVNHDDKDLKWFPNDEENLTSLRTLFKKHNVPNEFKGALIFSKDILLQFSKELISYPVAVFNEDRMLYMNLDVSHSEVKFIIKISGHHNIDLLSMNKDLLKEVVNANDSHKFILKPYNGTSL